MALRLLLAPSHNSLQKLRLHDLERGHFFASFNNDLRPDVAMLGTSAIHKQEPKVRPQEAIFLPLPCAADLDTAYELHARQ
jgi:hypothetical protein